MKKLILLTTFSMLVLFASVVSAGSQQGLKNDNQDIKQSKKQTNSRIVLYNNLSLAIDCWHDASLKGNSKAVDVFEQMISEIISDDIKKSYQSISYTKLEASYTQNEEENSENKIDNRKLQDEEGMLQAKKLLYTSLNKSKSFAYTYRLLADYLQLVKKESKAEKVEIAEDVTESKDDAGKVRLLK